MYTGTLTPIPSMIVKKLEYSGSIEPDRNENILLHQTVNISFIYDVENGKISVILNKEALAESVRELKAWMKDHKIPTRFEDSSMFFIDISALRWDDIAVLEQEGFTKREVENENSINHIWEMNE